LIEASGSTMDQRLFAFVLHDEHTWKRGSTSKKGISCFPINVSWSNFRPVLPPQKSYLQGIILTIPLLLLHGRHHQKYFLAPKTSVDCMVPCVWLFYA